MLAEPDYRMVLAIGYLTDRFGNMYIENIATDIKVIGEMIFFIMLTIKKIQAAVKWLDEVK